MVKGITPQGLRFALVHSPSDKAIAAYRELTRRYGHSDPVKADIIVALGGDGFFLETLRHFGPKGKGVFGMNRGTLGFLLNEFDIENLPERLDQAYTIKLYRLRATAQTRSGEVIKAKAINEVSLFRQSVQSAWLRVSINNTQRLSNLVCDGLVVSTPAGSTAYNLSADGPILPLEANLIALTPIAAFRPRRWDGALLHRNVNIKIEVLDTAKRPVAAAADDLEIRNVCNVIIETDRRVPLRLLFDHDKMLQERVLREQFLAEA